MLYVVVVVIVTLDSVASCYLFGAGCRSTVRVLQTCHVFFALSIRRDPYLFLPNLSKLVLGSGPPKVILEPASITSPMHCAAVLTTYNPSLCPSLASEALGTIRN